MTFVPPVTPLSLGLILLAAIAIAVLAGFLIGRVVRRLGRTSPIAEDLARRGRRPLRITLVLASVIAVLTATDGVSGSGFDIVVRSLQLALIASAAWLVGVLAFVLEDLAVAKYRIDVADNRHARRVRTQVMVLRRLTVVVITLLAAGAMLMTFPSARAFGTSLLASAGVLSVVAGLAAQTALANIFAGLQLAFTDALRVDDVVVVEKEWGRIEEITLTYVVVHIWDDRRLILPSTYFTTKPFENWTRHDAALLGTVEFDVDWRVDVNGMRQELAAALEATELWDQRVGILQVTDATNSFVTVRALMSAKDGPTMFDLRCYIRERLVTWLQAHQGAGLPRLRMEAVETARPARVSIHDNSEDALFSGSPEAEERSRAFGGDSDINPRL